MGKKKNKNGDDERVELVVAVEGDGIQPESVRVRETIAILEAAIALVEAVAREHNQPPPDLSLVDIRRTSAGYALQSRKAKDRATIRRTVDACKRRGEGFGTEVRRNLRRLYAAAKTGSLRVGGERKVVHLAAPVEGEGEWIEVVDQVYGKVIGVQAIRDEYRVTIRYTDGGSGTFVADAAVAQLAAPLFDKNVRASVTFLRGAVDEDGRIEDAVSFEEGDFLQMIRDARLVLERKGVHLGTDLLHELRKEDEAEDDGGAARKDDAE